MIMKEESFQWALFIVGSVESRLAAAGSNPQQLTVQERIQTVAIITAMDMIIEDLRAYLDGYR